MRNLLVNSCFRSVFVDNINTIEKFSDYNLVENFSKFNVFNIFFKPKLQDQTMASQRVWASILVWYCNQLNNLIKNLKIIFEINHFSFSLQLKVSVLNLAEAESSIQKILQKPFFDLREQSLLERNQKINFQHL